MDGRRVVEQEMPLNRGRVLGRVRAVVLELLNLMDGGSLSKPDQVTYKLSVEGNQEQEAKPKAELT